MSIQLIQQYYAKVEQLMRYGGTRNESTLRKPFFVCRVSVEPVRVVREMEGEP